MTRKRKPRAQSVARRVTAPARQEPASPVPPDKTFPVVGIGASAGGLDAFRQLLQSLPADTNMAFVLVQHLDPTHSSSLAEILAKSTSMPTQQVTDDLVIKPNNVYIIPPNTSLALTNGVLRLGPRGHIGTALRPIDNFFESLASDRHERAIGVVLSGAATDGTMGLEAIKGEAGITFAQDETAAYDSMPRSAIASGCVDFVLSPAEIAGELASIARHPFVVAGSRPSDKAGADGMRSSPDKGEPPPQEPGDPFGKILLLLRDRTAIDFSNYKTTTISRRINRRMVLNKVPTLEAYVEFLQENAGELDKLCDDAFINVTGFFRNPDAFEALKRKIFPRLSRLRKSDDPFRIWVPGCSTGQEAYSLAMAFTEFLDSGSHPLPLIIFATDINEKLLEKARTGLYAKSLVQDISRERLERFFAEEDGSYRFTKRLRKDIVFARHNLLSDPPFTRIDLIACRNVLIYIESGIQKKLISRFHYALKPHGCLFLGGSDSVGGRTDLFEPEDKKHKIYLKKPLSALGIHEALPRPATGTSEETRVKNPPRVPKALRSEFEFEREANRIILGRYTPPSVLIDADLHIIQFRGNADAYLRHPAGKPSSNLLKMAREGLMLPLRSAIDQAKHEHRTVRRENVALVGKGHAQRVSFEVVPVKNLKERYFLVFFDPPPGPSPASEDAPAAHRAPGRKAASAPAGRGTGQKEDADDRRRIADLENELSGMNEYVQSVQDQSESSNEALQGLYEEATSANEELQSVNEELETTSEELESTNEELTTLNDEMAQRNTELIELNNDLVNLQSSANLAIILLGRDLSIRRFSARAAEQFHLLASDVGRRINDIRHGFDLKNLEGLAAETIETVQEQELETRDGMGRWFLVRIRPYLTFDNRIDGIVLIVGDIDALKRTEENTAGQLETFIYSIAHDLRTPLRAMQGFAQILREDYSAVLDKTGTEYLGKIIHGSETLDALLRDLLEYSRVSQAEISLAPVALNEILQSALTQCQEKIRETDAQITIVPPLPAVRASAPILAQVLSNLVSNALKFVAPGVKPQISISADEKGAMIRVWIDDNGIGIAPEHRDRIFRVFERGHPGDYVGTGIGLAIVKKGIERLGGRVGIDPGQGKGTRFWIELQAASQ